MILGIEGPVLAGKSSLVRQLVVDLTTLGIDTIACPCYVEMAKRLGRSIPPGLSRSADEQLRAMRFFLELDQRRRDPRLGDVMLLDRTTWTLEAHAAALLSTGAIAAAVDIDELTRRAIHDLRPDALVYLDVPWPVQLQRASSRDELPPPFLDREFNAAFRAYFQATASEHRALWLDATRPLQTSAASVVDYLRTIDATDRQAPAAAAAPCNDVSSPGTESSRSFLE
jgi:thymidylate kinase